MPTDIDLNKIVPELIKQFGAPIFTSAKSLSKSLFDKFKVEFELCFSKYIYRHYDKYSKTKTLLYRGEPVNLRDFYVRTDLVSSRGVTLSEGQVIDFIESKKRFVVVGSAGSGKSTFCRSVFLDLVEKPRGIFPVFIELRHLNVLDDLDILDYIFKMLADFEPGFSMEQLEGSLRLGKVLIIFDGFDEVSLDKRELFERQLLKLSGKYLNIMMLVSSRVDTRFESWEDFYQYEMQPLDVGKAKELVGKLKYDSDVKEKFLNELDVSLYERHQSFAENPLLLTMMLLTYEQFAEIPNKIHLFYEQAFLTLFNKHDSLKSLFRRKSYTGLPIDDFKKILSAFCALSYVEGDYSFSSDNVSVFISKAVKLSGIPVSSEDFLNDLLHSVCIMQRDGLEVTFTHRSFQEYFTALFLVGFTGERKFELIEKVAYANDGDDVIPMIFDINQDMIEQDFFIPALEAVFKVVTPNAQTDMERLQQVSYLYKGVTTFDSEYGRDVAFMLRGMNNKSYLFELVNRIYGRTLSYHDDVDAELVELIDSHGGTLECEEIEKLDAKELNVFSNSHLSRFIDSEYLVAFEELQRMKKRQSEKREDVSGLFFI